MTEVKTKHYIGRKFSLTVFKTTCEPSEPIPDWAIRCDGAPAYIDEWGHMLMDAVLPNGDGKMITGYGCHETWTVKEEQMEEHTITITISITDKYLHEIIDTIEKIVADQDGDMLLMSRIEYAERLSAKAASPADGYTKDFLYDIVLHAVRNTLSYKTIVYILHLYGCIVTGPEVENYEFLKS